MRYAVFIIVILNSMITSCSEQQPLIISKWENGNPKTKQIFYDSKDSLRYQLISYYPNGVMKEITHFYGDEVDGWNTKYYLSGMIKDSIFFQNNLPFTSSMHFFNNETIMSEGTYNEAGMKDGWWYYYDSVGVKNMQTEYFNGDKKGVTFFFNSEGARIKEELRYSNGLISEIINYKDSIKHGEYTSMNIHGSLVKKGSYNEGSRIGLIWNIYYESGEKCKEVIYETDRHGYYSPYKLINFWDEEGRQTVFNGIGITQKTYCQKGVKYEVTKKYDNGKETNIQRKIVKGKCH